MHSSTLETNFLPNSSTFWEGIKGAESWVGGPPWPDHLLSWNVGEDGSYYFLLISVCKSALT